MAGTAPEKLDGWKEIAAYLGRDVTTAIRWERERGLPIHRLPGGKRGAVYAYPQEIDRWQGGDGAQRDDRGGVSAAAGLESHQGPGPGILPKRRLAWGLTLAALVLSLAVGARRGGWVSQQGSAAQVALHTGVVDRVDIERSGMVARDVQGRELWRYTPDAPIDVESMTGLGQRYVIADLDADSQLEVVASLSRRGTGDTPQDELLCFSRTGRIRWRQQMPDVVSFRGGTFGPPWSVGSVVVFRVDGQPRIAWSQNAAPSWPSVLTVLGGDGRRLSSFVHSGSIYALAAYERSDGPVILAGVVSNSNRAAGLFAVDGRAASGHSSEPAGSAYECLGCPPGKPVRYFLFPPSELNTALGRPYNIPFTILVGRDGFDVTTSEGLHTDPLRSAEQRYSFSSSFELLRAYHDDNSWPVHELLERSGKLQHSVADCSMFRTPPPVRAWDATGGWRDLKPTTGTRVTVGPLSRATRGSDNTPRPAQAPLTR